MKRHPTTSGSGRKRSVADPSGTVARCATTALKGNPRTRSGLGEGRLALARSSVWTHTLVLSGALDRRSAHALEAEIERLGEEGVTGITLDLRELTYIDAIGVAVIAFRCGHCRRHGFDLKLIPGSPVVQDAFEKAGVAESLPFEQPGLTARPQTATTVGEASEMIPQRVCEITVIARMRTGQAP